MFLEFFTDLLAFVYPNVCSGCGNALYRHEKYICNACYVSLPRTDYHLYTEHPLQKLFYGRVDLAVVSSYLFFQKKGKVQAMMHALKYKNKPELAFLFGKWYGLDLKKIADQMLFDGIIPIPLHKKRLQKRGYNQSEYFARGLSESMNIPVWNGILIRSKFTESQTFKSRAERMENMLESFEVVAADKIKHKHILLVDDVITTGATTEACVLQLQKYQAARVSVSSIAFAQ